MHNKFVFISTLYAKYNLYEYVVLRYAR